MSRILRSLRNNVPVFIIFLAASGLVGCDSGRVVDPPSTETVEQVTVAPRSATLVEGDTMRLSATGVTTDGRTVALEVTWESLDTAVATISSAGLLLARKPGRGRAVGRAKNGGAADSADVIVEDPPVRLTGIVVRPGSVTLDPGGVQAFSATGVMSDGSEEAVAVGWSAAGGQIDDLGVFTAGTQSGTFRVIALHAAGHADTASAVVVEPPAEAVAAIHVTPALDTLEVGATTGLQARVVGTSGSIMTDVTVDWTSSSPVVATVDSGGVVTGRMAGSVLIVAAVAGVADTSNVLVRPSSVPEPVPSFEQRPYTADSPWNTPIAADAPIDPNSAAMIATIQASNTGTLRSDPTRYAYPVYFADASTPRVTLVCSGYVSVIERDGSRNLIPTGEMTNVPLPAGATPSEGTDGQIIVIDVATGDEYDIWRFQSPNVCENATKYVQGIRRSAVEPNYGSRGAGVPYLAGLIRPWEIAAGRIEHALAFGYMISRLDRCVWPAGKTDGDDDRPDAIPQGARLRLDPAVDVEQIPGLDAAGRVIARALQEYGMILIDNSGSNKIYVEDNLTADWGTQIVATTVSAIPVERLQVLRLPDAYRAQNYAPSHGDCVR